MKPSSLLLVASLLANAAIVALYVTHRSENSLPARSAPPAAVVATRPDSTSASDSLRAALASGNAAQIEAMGVSPEIARELVLGRTLARIAERARATQAKSGADGRWWRTRNGSTGAREELLLSRRELADAFLTAFGSDLGLGGADPTLLSFLSAEKRDALRRITQDYDEMFAKFSSGGPQLASDKERLRLLRAERDRDIAALLSPEEKLAYEMRTSGSGATVRSRYGDAIESEAEFQKIFALQKAFDENFSRDALTGRISPDMLRARNEAERQLDTDLRATVGDDRYAALRRATDPDAKAVDALAARLNLPPTTTSTVVAARDAFATESQRINSDTTVPFPQRRAQIQDLATRAKSDLTRTLGTEGAEAYAQSAQWLNLLGNGMAYSTTPQPGSAGSLLGGTQSVYPVMPTGTSISSGNRQMFVTASPPAGIDGGLVGDRASTTSNVHVMTFNTSTGDAIAAPAGGATSPVLVVPAPAAGSTAAPKP